MRSKKILLNGARLYLILDREVRPYHRLFEIAREAVAAGVDIIQLRDKSGSAGNILDFSVKLSGLTKGKIPLIVNDRIDLALAAKVSGVHLGQQDLPVKEARKLAGRKFLIGVSCQTVHQALKAQREGADYVGFGSVFKTQTKPDRSPMDPAILRRVMSSLRIPVFAIGGIDLNNIEKIRELGVRRIAVCRAICKAKDVGRRVRLFKDLIG